MRLSIQWPLILLFILFNGNIVGQDLEPFELSETWLNKIENLAPVKVRYEADQKKKILIFSLHTGYKHWTIPHTEAVMKLLGSRSGAFEMTTSKDISEFTKEQLKKYDAIILNNTCSDPKKRNLFYDQLKKDSTLTEDQILEEAHELELNLLNYVKSGGGLMVLHGAITMQNKSMAFSEMIGGSFDYHPKQQNVHVELVNSQHPLVEGLNPNGFEHIDEPYFFKNAYNTTNFRPLLFMKVNPLKELRDEDNEEIVYISWIKKYGQGRVFYASPSHNAQSFENAELLQFFLDGMQYVVGDVPCDDTPIREDN